jgi:hypothetical protein
MPGRSFQSPDPTGNGIFPVFPSGSTNSPVRTRGKTNGRWKQYSGRNFPVPKTGLFPLLPKGGKPWETNGSDRKQQRTPRKSDVS